jgi:hypothetical protein
LIQKNEVLLKSNDEWLHFANPQKVVLAEQSDEMRGALRDVERLARGGLRQL